MAILAPLNWCPVTLDKPPLLKQKHGLHLTRHRETEIVRQAEEHGHFLNVSRDFIISTYVHCHLSSSDSRYNEVIGKSIACVKVIDISNMRVRHLNDLSLCTGLQVLILANNFVSNIDALVHCQHLLKLDLHGNLVSALPSAGFWNQLTQLRILYLHDNPLGGFRSVDSLSGCPHLALLTLHETPLCLKKHYRHHVINTIWSLKALDQLVVSDEEIIDGANFGGRFTACSKPFMIDPCPGVMNDEVNSVWQLMSQINSIISHHSAVIIIQRFVRGHLIRQALRALDNTRLWAAVTIQRKYREWKNKCEQIVPAVVHLSPIDRPQTVGAESLKLDYDTYLKNLRPGSQAMVIDTDGHHTQLSNNDVEESEPSRQICVDVDHLERVLNYINNAAHTLSRKHWLDHVPPCTPIETYRYYSSYEVCSDSESDEDDISSVMFRLQGMRPPVTMLSVAEELKAEQKMIADGIRIAKDMNHSTDGVRSLTEHIELSKVQERMKEGHQRIDALRMRRQQASQGAVWLHCLNAVAADYRKVEADEKVAKQKAVVQQRRNVRNEMRNCVTAELERQRTWTKFVDLTERRAVSSALQYREAVEQQTAQLYHDARRRSADFEKVRRRDDEFTRDVARRINACSLAHVRFLHQEKRTSNLCNAVNAVRAKRDDESEKRNILSQLETMKKESVLAQTIAERQLIESTLLQQNIKLRDDARCRVSVLRRANTEHDQRQIILLPIISNPH